jgi:hypothetical protein
LFFLLPEVEASTEGEYFSPSLLPFPHLPCTFLAPALHGRQAPASQISHSGPHGCTLSVFFLFGTQALGHSKPWLLFCLLVQLETLVPDTLSYFLVGPGFELC